MEEGLLLFRQSNDTAQAPLDQALFGGAGLFGGKPSLLGKAQTIEQGLFFLSRETRQCAEVGKVGLQVIVGRVVGHRLCHGASFLSVLDYWLSSRYACECGESRMG